MAFAPHTANSIRVTALAVALLTGHVSSTSAQDEVPDHRPTTAEIVAGEHCDRCPAWAATVESLFLWQGNIASRPLLSSFDGAVRGPTALDANQLLPATSAGPRVDLLWRPDRMWSLQGNYFNVSPFNAARSVVGTPELAEENLAGFSDSGFETASASGSGAVQSAEFNLRRRRDGASTTWIAGFRWVQLNQSLDMQGFDSAPDMIDYTLNSSVGNDLYGGQIGFDTMLWNNMRGPVRVNAVGKAGIYGNAARQTMRYRDNEGFDLKLGDSMNQVSFFGEVGLNASIVLRRWLAIRAGYTLLWASAVAVPAGQFSVNDFSRDVAGIDASSSVFLHGVSVGGELRW
ncbi:MAG: hypothetical protein ACKO6B_02905 [Planctomycetia bacterium]